MTETEILQVFRDSGALLEGHFILRSGLRSRQYFQCALALQHMPTVEKLGAELAGKLRALGAVTVVSPAMPLSLRTDTDTSMASVAVTVDGAHRRVCSAKEL